MTTLVSLPKVTTLVSLPVLSMIYLTWPDLPWVSTLDKVGGGQVGI